MTEQLRASSDKTTGDGKKNNVEPPQDVIEAALRRQGDRRAAVQLLLNTIRDWKSFPQQLHTFGGPEKKRNPWGETLKETALMFLAQKLIDMACKKSGIPIGNANEDVILKMFREKPVEVLLNVIVVGPFVETVISQGVPDFALKRSDAKDLALGKEKSMRWDVGVPIAFLFAGHHNITGEGIKMDVIPLNQFLGGLFMWYLTRKEGRGLDHAIVAHAENNTIAFAELLLRRFP